MNKWTMLRYQAESLIKNNEISGYFSIYILLTGKGFYTIKYIFHGEVLLKEKIDYPPVSAPPHCLIDREIKYDFIKNKLTDEMIKRMEEIIRKNKDKYSKLHPVNEETQNE